MPLIVSARAILFLKVERLIRECAKATEGASEGDDCPRLLQARCNSTIAGASVGEQETGNSNKGDSNRRSALNNRGLLR